MAGLVPAIHVFFGNVAYRQGVDARHEDWHAGELLFRLR